MQFDSDDTTKIGKVVRRAKEPSTMAGIALLLTLFGVDVEDATILTGEGVNVLGAVFALLAIFVPEKK